MYANAYIFFEGNCAEALKFYEKTLGAHVEMSMTYGETPAAAHVPPVLHDKVIHARLMLGNTAILASDCPPDKSAGKPGGYSLTLSVDSPETAEKVFAALTDGGRVTMAMNKTFFAEKFGQGGDRFGIPWMVICDKAL